MRPDEFFEGKASAPEQEFATTDRSLHGCALGKVDLSSRLHPTLDLATTIFNFAGRPVQRGSLPCRRRTPRR